MHIRLREPVFPCSPGSRGKEVFWIFLEGRGTHRLILRFQRHGLQFCSSSSVGNQTHQAHHGFRSPARGAGFHLHGRWQHSRQLTEGRGRSYTTSARMLAVGRMEHSVGKDNMQRRQILQVLGICNGPGELQISGNRRENQEDRNHADGLTTSSGARRTGGC